MKTLGTASKQERISARAFYVPKAAEVMWSDEDGSALYTYTIERDGRTVPYALGFRGTAARPEFHHCYRTEDARAAALEAFRESVGAHHARKAARQSEKAAWINPLTIGAILYTSWGYDQTNVEFFVVTRVSGRRTWVREIAADSEETGFMSGNCWPRMPIEMVGDETMHIAQPSGPSGVYVKIDECRHAWLEQGRSHGFSTYA